MNTLAIRAENLIQIGSLVSEIWPGKVKSRGGGRVYSSRRVYLAKYGNTVIVLMGRGGGVYIVRGADYGKYPSDTIFGYFLL